MYGIKGYIFLDEGKGKLEVGNEPFEALSGYDKGHEFMETTIDTVKKILGEGEEAPKVTGYMFLLTPKVEEKEE